MHPRCTPSVSICHCLRLGDSSIYRQGEVHFVVSAPLRAIYTHLCPQHLSSRMVCTRTSVVLATYASATRMHSQDMMHDLLLLLDQLSRSVLGEPAAAAPHPLEPAAAVDAPQSPVAAAVVSDVANEPFTPPNVVLPTHKRPAPSPEASSSRRRRKNHSLQPQRLLDEA
jgi:hypothetical protein